jgi:hypothetical protein
MFKHDSPHTFSQLLFQLKKRDFFKYQYIFPTESWKNLAEIISRIHSELVDPLFLKKAVNIKDEDSCLKHRKNNLFCCLQYFIRELSSKRNDHEGFNSILKEFQTTYQNIVLAANKNAKVDPFFSRIWGFDVNEPGIMMSQLNKECDQIKETEALLKAEINSAKESDKEFYGFMEEKWTEWNKCLEKRGEIEDKIERLKMDRKRKMGRKIVFIDEVLKSLVESARGKPGRHPKPFNVLTYHLINECTRWKIDPRKRRRGKNPYAYRKDGKHRGEHKFERDWRLVIYLLLDIHLFSAELPEIQRFIDKHGKKPADKALKTLKNILWNSYKNFPPKDGWSFPRKAIAETGFRKLIVNNDGRLQIVRL